jgi:hypothetical protein
VEEDSGIKKVLTLLGNLGGDKGVPESKPKGVRGGKQLDFSKFFKVKDLNSGEAKRYKSIFEILGQTLLIGKYAKTGPEAEALKGSVAAPIAQKVNDSEDAKNAGQPDGKGGGILGGLFGGLLKGAIGLGAMILALGALAFVLKMFAGIEAETLFKAGGALLGLVVIAKLAKKGLIRGALGIAAMVGVLYLLLEKVLIPFQSVNWETLGKAGAALLGLVVIGKFAKPNMILGGVALGIMAGVLALLVHTALIPLQEIEWPTIGKAFVALLAIGVIGAVAGVAAPFIIAGAIALGALGVALLPMAAAARIAAPAIEALSAPIDATAGVLDKLANVPVENLLLIGPALGAIGLGLVAMSGGNLVGAVADKFASFFFNDKGPIQKLTELGKAAPDIIKLGNAFDTISDFSFSDIDLEGDFNLAAVGVNNLTGSMNKLAISQQKVVGLFEQINDSTSEFRKSGATGINNTFKMDKELVDVNKQQVGLLSQIKDGIMMLVDKPTNRSSNRSMVERSNNVKKLDTTLDFNKSMGISNIIQ